MFADAMVLDIPHEENEKANNLSQQASRYKETPFELIHEEYPMEGCLQVVDSWIKELVNYLNDLSTSIDFKLN